jgi:hypothetical protein
MRESRTYGSVRGAPSNGRPYRDPAFADQDREGRAEESTFSSIGIQSPSFTMRRTNSTVLSVPFQ